MALERGLSFGLHDHPKELNAVWGARWIYPDDFVGNRQDFVGIDTEDGKKLMSWLNNVGIRKAVIAAGKKPVTSDEMRTVVLYEDEIGIIKGSPSGSYGYLYVCGYLKEVIDNESKAGPSRDD